MAGERNLLVGGVALTRNRVKGSAQALLLARNEMEQALAENGYLADAPFRTVSLIVRYGHKDNMEPEFGRIDDKNRELPVAVELDVARLRGMTPDELKEEFRTVMIEVLCDVAANFDLPFEFLDAMRP